MAPGRFPIPVLLILAFVLGLCTSPPLAMVERPAPAPPPSNLLTGKVILDGPMVLSSGGDTTWIQVHTDSTYCPGDPYQGHGGEATGGPGPMETWCFEGGAGDSCGTNPPWDTRCFTHVDVRREPSPSEINFWHVDTYRADQRAYCGDYCLWCGSDAIWTDGGPVDCGTWAEGKAPGYGNQWNCIVELTLPDTFTVANGCTLYFDPRYDTECKYDYFYVDFFDGTEWRTLATFNASSNNPGGRCGDPSKPNPDYWGNTDTGQPSSADWEDRTDPALPAFYRVITPDTLMVTSGPRFRWRFVSDGAWSDADGHGDTDGAAFVDNVWVCGDSQRFTEDFESGYLDTDFWSLPDPDGVIDLWHMTHDADPPDEEAGYGCGSDSSLAFRGRPENGYQAGQPWRNQWYYRLLSPSVALESPGCLLQYDVYCFINEVNADWALLQFRFHNSDYDQWCPWRHAEITLTYSWCTQYFWWEDQKEDVWWAVRSGADSVQFAWDLFDYGKPGDLGYGHHGGTDLQVDNVSIGFYDPTATRINAAATDLLHDTFHDNLCGFNSRFEAVDPDSVTRYSGPPYDDVPLAKDYQLWVDVTDTDGLVSVNLLGSIDGGAFWISVPMTVDRLEEPGDSSQGGEYYGTLCPEDFGLEVWDIGSTACYYVEATDVLANVAYWPDRADPANAYHLGTPDDYMSFSILPLFPDSYTGPKILLVDGYGRKNYDYAPCVERMDRERPVLSMYEDALTGAGYCYDTYNISGAGSNVQAQPIWFDDYDCVVWFTGSYFSNYLFYAEAQQAMRDYLGTGGKVVLLGDRIAWNMAGAGQDSLGGEFLAGIMGCEYLQEMESPYDRPYVYAAGVETLDVFGSPVEVGLGTMAVYRFCPYLKDMSYITVNAAPPAAYTAQRLMYLTDASVGEADAAIYTEYEGVGQCVFVNFDLSASVNSEQGYCSGLTPGSTPDFAGGTYDGRVELLRTILENIFGLPSNGGGTAAVEPPMPVYHWHLAQNVPNPCVEGTEIEYETARPVHAVIKIYDALGRKVRTLVDGTEERGRHAAYWDGCNAQGERVTSGVYFYKIEAGFFTATRKMLVLR
jgi:hypothetical protein